MTSTLSPMPLKNTPTKPNHVGAGIFQDLWKGSQKLVTGTVKGAENLAGSAAKGTTKLVTGTVKGTESVLGAALKNTKKVVVSAGKAVGIGAAKKAVAKKPAAKKVAAQAPAQAA